MQSTSKLVEMKNSDCQSLGLYNQDICITSVSEIPSTQYRYGHVTKRIYVCVIEVSTMYYNNYHHAYLSAQKDGDSESQSSATFAIAQGARDC